MSLKLVAWYLFCGVWLLVYWLLLVVNSVGYALYLPQFSVDLEFILRLWCWLVVLICCWIVWFACELRYFGGLWCFGACWFGWWWYCICFWVGYSICALRFGVFLVCLLDESVVFA